MICSSLVCTSLQSKWERTAETKRGAYVCARTRSSAHVDGCIQLQIGLWIGNLALAPPLPTAPLLSLKGKEHLSTKIPSPTLELLYEALSQLWHKDNCLANTHTNTHNPALCLATNKFKILQNPSFLPLSCDIVC